MFSTDKTYCTLSRTPNSECECLGQYMCAVRMKALPPLGVFSHLCSLGWCCSTGPEHWALSGTRWHLGLQARSLRYIRTAPQLLQQSCFQCACHAWAREPSCTELHWFLGRLEEMKEHCVTCEKCLRQKIEINIYGL